MRERTLQKWSPDAREEARAKKGKRAETRVEKARNRPESVPETGEVKQKGAGNSSRHGRGPSAWQEQYDIARRSGLAAVRGVGRSEPTPPARGGHQAR